MPLRILLIEPDALLQRELTLVLQCTGGYEVEPRSCVEQALSLLMSRPFALLLARQSVLSRMPASMVKIGYGHLQLPMPEHCLGWIEPLPPLPAFAERVRNLLEGGVTPPDAR